MFKNLTIRKKLALLLLGPLLALLAIAGLGIRSGLSDLSDATDADRRVDMAVLNGRLFDALRAEAVQNQNSVMAQQNLDEVRGATDAAGAAWLAKAPLFEQLDVENDLIESIRNLGAHRDLVTAEFATNGAGAEIVYDADMALLSELVAFDARVAGRAEPSVATELLKANDLNEAALTAADAQLLGMWAANSNVIPSDDLSRRLDETNRMLEGYRSRAEPAEQVRAVEGDFVSLSESFGLALAGDATTVDAAAWETASTEQATAISEARRTLLNRAGAAAAASSNDARGTARNLGALALVGLVLGLLSLIMVGNGLRKRLTTLSSEAAAMAKHDLPDLAATLSGGEPTRRDPRPSIEVEGGDEIAEVSESLNDIRRATESVASQQDQALQSGISDMFVNLARRNQTLVDRQLEVIDQLESNERDSDRLAQMYRVDHLATRMRRNAESLLVLAGQSSPRRRGPAIELREVVRVAIGEVEDYRRIVPVALDELLVGGHVAQDLAHLLSELMENATQSSAPGTVADVIGMADANGSYTLQVIDRGTGLTEDRRAELNRLLAHPPSNSLSMSRSLGLTVVGRLAKRMAVSVALTPGTDGGTIAAVTIPADVVTEWRAGEPVSNMLTAPLPEAEPAPEPAPAPSGMIELSDFGLDPIAEPEPAPVVETTITEPEPIISEPVPPAAPAFPAAAVDAVPTTPSEVFGAVDVPPLAEAPPAMEAPVFDAPIVDAPTFDAPSFEAPSLEAPAFGAPVIDPAPVTPDVAPGFPTPPTVDTPPIAPLTAEAPIAAAAPTPPVFEPAPVAPPAFETPAPAGDPIAPLVPPATEAPAPFADVPQVAETTPPPVAAPTPPPAPSFDAPPIAPLSPEPAVAPPVPAPPVMDVPPAPPAVSAPEPGAVFDLVDPAPEAPVAPSVAPTPEPATTPTGLVRRRRTSGGEAPRIDDTRTAPSKRSPDQVKNMLSRYKTGLERGRTGGQEPGQ